MWKIECNLGLQGIVNWVVRNASARAIGGCACASNVACVRVVSAAVNGTKRRRGQVARHAGAGFFASPTGWCALRPVSLCMLRRVPSQLFVTRLRRLAG